MNPSTNRINRLDWKSLEGSVADVLKPAIRGQHKTDQPSQRGVSSLISHHMTVEPSTDFEFFEEISSDPWMTSHAAYDRRLNRHVMIRQLKPKAMQDAEITNQFWERAQRLASVEHHHVARVHDVDPQQGWIILERLTQSVASRLESGQKYTVEEAFLLFKQGLEGLTAFHNRGQSHGAICTSNLALTEQGWLKLTDPQGFSVDEELPLPDEIRRHIAPEMLSPNEFGSGGLVTDLYCLGFAVLDAMAADKLDEVIGIKNTSHMDAGQVWTAWHTSPRQNLPNLAEIIPGLEGPFEKALLSVISKKTSTRPQDATAALQLLNENSAVVTSLPSEAVETTHVEQLTDMQDYLLNPNSAPGAVLMGESASVYSIPDEIIEEPDLLDKLSDVDWWNEQVRNPMVHVPVILVIALISFALMQPPKKAKEEVAATNQEAMAHDDKVEVEENRDTNQLGSSNKHSTPPPDPNGDNKAHQEEGQAEKTETLPVEIKKPVAVAPVPERDEVEPTPPVQSVRHLTTSWSLECPASEKSSVRAGISYLLEDAWEQRTLTTATRLRFESLQKMAPDEPRLVYAYGLLLIKKNKYDDAQDVLEHAAELQDRLFEKKTKLARIFEGDPVPTELQPIPDLRPRQMLIWTTLMQCANTPDLVEVCAMQISELLQQMNTEVPSTGSSNHFQDLRNECIQFSGRAAGVLKAHFSDRLRQEVIITEWVKRCENMLQVEKNDAHSEERDLFQSSMAEMADQHRYNLESLVDEHERIIAEQAQKPSGPVITKEHTITNEEVTEREENYYWGEKNSERKFTSRLNIKSNPVRTYKRRRPQLADVSLRSLFPADLLYRRNLLKKTIPAPNSERELAAR